MINKNGLVMRLAVVVLFSAIAVGVLSTQVFYRLTYVSELEHSKKHIEQLYQTVSATSSIATYLEDSELAKEVVNGLLTNDVVQGVSIASDGLKVATESFLLTDNTSEFQLLSPFEDKQVIGRILITPDLATIEQRAKQISSDNVIALSIQSGIATIILMVVSYIIITSPIISIAKNLHTTTLGTSQRVDIPLQHKHSELGDLVVDINNLLSNAEHQIQNERKLRNEVETLSKHFRLLFDNSLSPVILADPKGNIILCNKAFEQLLKIIGVPFQSSFGPYLVELFEDQKQLNSTVDVAFGNNEVASGEFELVNYQNQTPIWMQVIITTTLSEDYRELYQITLHDISKRKQQLDKLNLTAKTDKLTMLLNRRGAEEQIEHLLTQHVPFALALIDLNGFKPINDQYGHEVGDEILVHVAEQLTSGLRQRDILSRWGGDEFIIVVPETNITGMIEVSKKIIECVARPYTLDEETVVAVGCSIGVAFYPDDDVQLKPLIERADKAMYVAKSNKHDLSQTSYVFYQDTITSSSDN